MKDTMRKTKVYLFILVGICEDDKIFGCYVNESDALNALADFQHNHKILDETIGDLKYEAALEIVDTWAYPYCEHDEGYVVEIDCLSSYDPKTLNPEL